MSVSEFYNIYHMHDSCLEKIEYSVSERKLTFYVTFCEFMQDYYKDDDYANSDRIITFYDVSEFIFPDHIVLSADEFMEQKLTNDHSVTYYMRNDCEPEGYQIAITCNRVETTVDKYYNL